MRNKQFIEIMEGGYIMSDVMMQLLLEISKVDFSNPGYQNEMKNISNKFTYEVRFSVLILFIDYCLLDNLITEEETADIQSMKSVFEIISGDFYQLYKENIARIIQLQYHLYKLDHQIDFGESQEIGFLQKIFDIESGQVLEFILLEDYD